MSLYRVGKTWYLDIPTPKGRLRASTRTADKRAAQEYHDKVKADLWRQAKLGEAPPVTWGEAVKQWLLVKSRGLPDRYRIAKLNISSDLALPSSDSFWTSRLEKVVSKGSWNRYAALLIAIHNTAGVSPPKIKKAATPEGRTRWLSAEEWERLKKALDVESPLLRQAAEFSLATGLRENNVLELTWDQVDLKRRVAWLHGDQVKTRVPVGVPLNDAACAILAERNGIDKRWVFGNPDYPLTKASNRAWYTALRKAKLVGFRWHDLRHTWASWAVMGGVRLEELQRLGGWKTTQMVQRYAHLSSEHLAEAAAKIKPVTLRNVTKTTIVGG